MRRWDAGQIAHAAGARLIQGSPGTGPERVTIDSRDAGPGVLFVGLPGAHVDGGSYALSALERGAWGVLVGEHHAASLHVPGPAGPGTEQAVIAAADPLVALQQLARAWRRVLAEEGVTVIGVTGSTGKTSTKDLLKAVLSPHRRTVASKANQNTEIGLPLQILAAPLGTEVLVLEMAMRGSGQIAELCEIAEPDVGVIVNVGPVHLELLGSVEAVAAAKAEMIERLPAGGVAVVPFGETLLAPHLRPDLRTITFGDGGDVRLLAARQDHLDIDLAGRRVSFEVSLSQSHLQTNLLAAAAAAYAIGLVPGGRLEFEPAEGRGRHLLLPGGITLIDGAYNANPMSMRAALEELDLTGRESAAGTRRVAVLGGMLELGPDASAFHEAVGEYARGRVDLLITVGPLAQEIAGSFDGAQMHLADAAAAAEVVPGLLHDGDVVLVKGSLGIGLKRVCDALTAGALA